jgi:hypothetical protein
MYLFLTPSLNLPKNGQYNFYCHRKLLCWVIPHQTTTDSRISTKFRHILRHSRKVFMQNVRHVFEIAIAILKFKMTVKFHSKIITNFVLTLNLQNTQGWTSALFTARQIGFLIYPEDWSSKLLHNVGTYLPTDLHGVITQEEEITQLKVIKENVWSSKKEFNALKLI